jgi:hypothetical protein
MVRWVVLRDDFRVLIAVMRGGIIREKTVVVARTIEIGAQD